MSKPAVGATSKSAIAPAAVPKASPEEEEKKRKERYAKLAKCFRACDLDENGLIDTFEMEVVVRSFNPQCSNVEQEVKTVLGKLDKNQDNKIDLNEWTTGLLELFQFMSNDAFEHHCDELLQLIKTNADRVRQQLLTPGAAGAGAGSQSARRTTATPGLMSAATPGLGAAGAGVNPSPFPGRAPQPPAKKS